MKRLSLAAIAASAVLTSCTPAPNKPSPPAETAAAPVPGGEVKTFAPPTAAQDIAWGEWAGVGFADAGLDWPSGAAVSGGKLYLVGTRRAAAKDAAKGAYTAEVAFVEISPRGAETRAIFPSNYGERADAGVAAAPDGRIWFVGGFYTPAPLRGVPEGQLDYAPVGTPVAEVNSWKPGERELRFEAALPVPRGDAAVFFSGQQLFVVAGLFNKSNAADENNQQLHDFDLRDRLWRKYHNFKFATSKPAACVLNDGLYILGGKRLQPAYVTNVCFRYDLLVFKWERVPPLPSPRAGAAAYPLGPYIYIVGGYSSQPLGQPPKLATEVFRYDTRGHIWEKLPTPAPEGTLFTAYDGEAFYLIGPKKTYRGTLVQKNKP